MAPILVPLERLSPEALRGLVDAFVLREGTDYGHHEPALEDKRADVMRQLERGEVVVVFDPRTEGCNLMPRRDLPSGVA
ncbi:MAG TPA: YheU family protein [Sandaracinaceae bacterium LLY-WYZ-13_1]|nr:YheU family protein [Sandaracinaceae bacterium LLY-WYZ-13_1]